MQLRVLFLKTYKQELKKEKKYMFQSQLIRINNIYPMYFFLSLKFYFSFIFKRYSKELK